MQGLEHTQIGTRASLYEPLSDRDVGKVADAALEVLEKSGVAVYSPTAFEAFRKAGASCHGETRIVKLPAAVYVCVADDCGDGRGAVSERLTGITDIAFTMKRVRKSKTKDPDVVTVKGLLTLGA